jgi:hypothetical protein
MATAYGLHEIELRPGADPAAFEQLVAAAAELENFEAGRSTCSRANAANASASTYS